MRIDCVIINYPDWKEVELTNEKLDLINHDEPFLEFINSLAEPEWTSIVITVVR